MLTPDKITQDESTGGYWLRVPANRARPIITGTPKRPIILRREQRPVLEPQPSEEMFVKTTRNSGVERQLEFQTLPDMDIAQREAGEQARGLCEEEYSSDRGELQLEDEPEISHQTDSEEDNEQTTPNVPQNEDEQELPQRACPEERVQDPEPDSPIPLRRSTRERRPGQIFTYSSLGHPTYQSGRVNAMDTYLMPYTHLWYSQTCPPSFHYTPLIPYPHPPFICPIQ
ncbi:hypothetical protein F7725_018870, partial [Dissostichus mawsoni]